MPSIKIIPNWPRLARRNLTFTAGSLISGILDLSLFIWGFTRVLTLLNPGPIFLLIYALTLQVCGLTLVITSDFSLALLGFILLVTRSFTLLKRGFRRVIADNIFFQPGCWNFFIGITPLT